MSSTTTDALTTGTASVTGSLSQSTIASIGGSISDTITSALNSTISSSTTSAASSSSSDVEIPEVATPGSGQDLEGISLVSFLSALTGAIVIFAVQVAIFLLLRNKLARIFKPKTYLVPERERTDSPPVSPWGMINRLLKFKDREIINKCGLDAYFFLRYLQTLLLIFIPVSCLIVPILVPLNYSNGRGQRLLDDSSNSSSISNVTGLDTLAWSNIKPENAGRYDAHLFLAIIVIFWVCGVFFSELRVYIKIRQDYLTTAEHRLRASATTVLVNSIPKKWLSEKALVGLFDVFPGGIRNVWLTRDLTELLEKIKKRDQIHIKLEKAETNLIREAKKKQLKRREKEEKKARKARKEKTMTKDEREQREKLEDEKAQRLAASGGGISSGGTQEIPKDVAGAVEESRHEEAERDRVRRESRRIVPTLGTIGQGMKGGFTKANHGLLGGENFELTNGFMNIGGSSKPIRPGTASSDRRGFHSHKTSNATNYTVDTSSGQQDSRGFGNTVRRVTNLDDMYINENSKWYEFWKPPSGGYASPIPQGTESDEFPLTGPKTQETKSTWKNLNLFAKKELTPADYPEYSNFTEPSDREQDAEWEKWVKNKDRPTFRLPVFEWTPGWLPSLPFVNKKVDTIYWCRKELARLNLEIDEDQKNPDRYPLMSSAFVQFNHQVAAHMACQSVTHHIPKHMAPRDVEISPTDVIWDNMAITWWHEWIRTGVAVVIMLAMIVLWTIPVVWSSSLSTIDALVEAVPWLSFIEENAELRKLANILAGLLPAAFLALFLVLVPFIMDLLAGFKGCKTGAQKAEVVQTYYFIFLFVQVFLVVSVASFAFRSWDDFVDVGSDVAAYPEILATNLPSAANYFFSYMILQAMSTSSGTLLQIGTLFVWYVIARMFDSTARAKWNRNTKLPHVSWGSFFPVYTNFACIALIYAIVAPIICIFAVITFSLLWVAHRYNMLYVTRFDNDTGGVLYPRAINQTFTGLYVMELCLVGLFFLVEDEDGTNVCTPHAITMIVMIILTVIYQYLLNRSFSPLFRYLPITFEDEAVLRDEAFQRAQDQRLGLLSDDEKDDGLDGKSIGGESPISGGGSIELKKLGSKADQADGPYDDDDDDDDDDAKNGQGKFNPVRGIVHASTWAARGAARGGKNLKDMTFGKAETNYKTAASYRRTQRQKDLEAQRAIGEALYGGYHDEIEDLTPDERDTLVRHAFQHYALRSRRPVVWIPRDDMGVSDDEIKRTREFSEHVWISNEGTALDSKVRVVYGRNPPDFSEVDLINL
ncbi:uncharacterized protein MKZ38_000361 [Zalerion maritima]|uniref:DUF221-domain-containing protein n=1 Tax=Zalerion maritima TaxID=339359 RepID=A0AAD5RRP4_9PEZI|nr:uncharacterized protein MKZ38_000361 [Zalerion maritima]